MVLIKARFDGRVFIPQENVNLPAGLELEIGIPTSIEVNGKKQGLTKLVDDLERLPPNQDWPVDGAAQHDHYLYGAPKRP